MSTTHIDVPPRIGPPTTPASWKTIVHDLEDDRGTDAMLLFILSETFLFIMLFVGYFYLAQGTWRWLDRKPPALHYALPNLAIMLVSGGVAWWGETQIRRLRYGMAKLALGVTIVLGMAFLVLSAFDYKEHLRDLTPQTDAYGSIFYTITTVDIAHLCLGLFMLTYVLLLPKLEPRQWPPYRPYYNAVIYWYFVVVVWVFIVTFLYIAPNVR